MNDSLIQSVSRQVYQQFPEMRGCKPQSKTSGNNKLLVYETSVKTEDGKALRRTVRVTVNQNGEIIKISTSR